MAEYIAESTCIVRVDIRNNNVKVAGIMALQNALKNNYTLTRLDLDSEPKKEQVRRGRLFVSTTFYVIFQFYLLRVI